MTKKGAKMNKQTTIEEFEQNMTEYLPDFTKNTKKGGNVWTKVHVCNPERPPLLEDDHQRSGGRGLR